MKNLAIVLTNLDNQSFKSYVNKTSPYMFLILNDFMILYVKDTLKKINCQTCYVTLKNDSINQVLKDETVFNSIAEINNFINTQSIDNIIIINKCLPMLTDLTINTILKTHQDKNNDVTYFEGFYIFKACLFNIIQNDLFNISIANFSKIEKINILNNEDLIVNDRVSLAKANILMQERINTNLMLNGISIVSPSLTFIGKNVKIGNDSIIYPNTYLFGNTMVGTNCEIGPNAYIIDSFIDNNWQLSNCQIKNQSLKK